MGPKKRGFNRRRTRRFMNDELAFHNEIEECFENQRSVFENFQYLSQTEKIKVDEKFSKPRNDMQTKYVKELNNRRNKIVMATGPAGTGKTLFGTEYGIRHFLMGQYEKIIFTRPAVSADEDLGYLPGTLEEKMAPWVRPIYDILHNFITPKEITELLENKTIEIAPLAYMRGRTFKNTWIVADECQNTTPNQFKMLLTRIGENSRMVITGDLDQHDRMDEINGLADFLDKYRRNRSNSISCIEFDKQHVEREDVIKDVLSIYDDTNCDDTNCDYNYDDTKLDDEKTPSLISISPDSNVSVLDNIMERRSCSIDIDEENDVDDETNEDDNNSNINIPITSYINLGNYMYNQKQSNY
jgi:phosphate starvation-inducible PhoH-like protein